MINYQFWYNDVYFYGNAYIRNRLNPEKDHTNHSYDDEKLRWQRARHLTKIRCKKCLPLYPLIQLEALLLFVAW